MPEPIVSKTVVVTPEVDVGALLDLALHMANRADEIALAAFGSDPGVDIKEDGSPVTRVDREIEAMLRDTVDREHPRAGVIGEEYGEEQGVGRWVFDPIDGTREFIARDPRFATLIAYQFGGETLVGVVSAPALQLRWWAGLGTGAVSLYRGRVELARTSATRRWDRARGLILGDFKTRSLEEPPIGEGARSSRLGVSWDGVRVATGEYDFAVTSGAIWDVAPLALIVSEASGSAREDAQEGTFRLALSNRHLAGRVLPLVD